MSVEDGIRLYKRPARQKLEISLRNIQQDDVAFIFHSWLKSFRNGRMPSKVDNGIYFTEHHKLIERLVKRCTVTLAVDPKEPGNILGYIVYERIDGIFILHYIYVKHTFRNMGIGRELFESTGHDLETASCGTHATNVSEKLQHRFNVIYHPYILINYNEKNKEEVNPVSAPSKEDMKSRADTTGAE